MKRLTSDPPLLAVIVAFAISRVIYFWLGVRFDMTPLASFDQILDPLLLRERLAESLWYLHSQPPAFNLYLGLVLKSCAGFEATAFHVAAMLIGLLAAIAL